MKIHQPMMPFISPVHYAPTDGGGTTGAPVAAPPAKAANHISPNNLAAPAQLASSRTALMPHAEHMTDLVLDILPGSETGKLTGLEQFDTFVRILMSQIEAGEICMLNEKFDGSIAIGIGYDDTDRPYVAYKHHMEPGGKKTMPMVHTKGDAKSLFGDSFMGNALGACIKHLRRPLEKMRDDFRDTIVQADVLFIPGDDRRSITDEAVTIRANQSGITYVLPAGSALHEGAAHASIGLVVHTIGRRLIDPASGRCIGFAPREDNAALERFVEAITSRDVFAIHPFRYNVRIDRGDAPFSAKERKRVRQGLAHLHAAMAKLGTSFKVRCNEILPTLTIFLNSSLKEGGDGGIYRIAARGEPFDVEEFINALRAWLVKRTRTISIDTRGNKRFLSSATILTQLDALLREHPAEFRTYLCAYVDANRIQYLLMSHLAEANASKLGGGPIEGMMITDPVTMLKPKLVDRLQFTMLNFSGERDRLLAKRAREARAAAPRINRQAPRKDAPLPYPYNIWRDSAAFFIGKLQPPHAGHIAALTEAIKRYGMANVFVVPSIIAPNIVAADWRGIGAASSRKKLFASDFTHPFSRKLREDILKHGLPTGTRIRFAPTALFASYLSRAKMNNAGGSITRLVGAKEIEANIYTDLKERYGKLVNLVSMDMEHGGLCATDVRHTVRRLHESGDLEAYEMLQETFAFISPARKRNAIIGRLVKEWGDLEAVVHMLKIQGRPSRGSR